MVYFSWVRTYGLRNTDFENLTVASLFGNFLRGLPLKFQYTTFGSIKISGKEIFTGSLAGSQPEMTIFDLMGDFSETGEVNGFMVRCTSSQFKVPWQKIAIRRRNCEEKKDDATVKDTVVQSYSRKMQVILIFLLVRFSLVRFSRFSLMFWRIGA